jgi:hypothetical protein
MGRQAGDVKVLGEIGNATPARLHHRPLTHRFLHPPMIDLVRCGVMLRDPCKRHACASISSLASSRFPGSQGQVFSDENEGIS